MSLSRAPIQHPLTKPATAPYPGPDRFRLQPHFSLRHAHVLRLHDLVHHLISLPPSYANSVQSLRAWRALAKCPEIDLRALYLVGAKILERTREEEQGGGEEEEEESEWRAGRRAEWLKWNQEGKWDRVDKMIEYTIALAAAGRARHALEELDSFLPAHPYHDSITLNTLAGLLALLIAQPTNKSSSSSSSDSDSDSDASSKLSPRKRKAVNASSTSDSLDRDFTYWVRDVSHLSSDLFDKAREHFRRAARLERKNPESSSGEAARWLAILEPDRLGKRSRSESQSPSP